MRRLRTWCRRLATVAAEAGWQGWNRIGQRGREECRGSSAYNGRMPDKTRKLVVKSLRKRGATVSVAAARKAVRDAVVAARKTLRDAEGAIGDGKSAARSAAIRASETATGSGQVSFKFPTRAA